LVTSLFGATDEWHQSFTPGRHAGADDWAKDTVSAAVALYLWSKVSATPLQAVLRPLAPLAVGAAFLLGTLLAMRGMALPWDAVPAGSTPAVATGRRVGAPVLDRPRRRRVTVDQKRVARS